MKFVEIISTRSPTVSEHMYHSLTVENQYADVLVPINTFISRDSVFLMALKLILKYILIIVWKNCFYNQAVQNSISLLPIPSFVTGIFLRSNCWDVHFKLQASTSCRIFNFVYALDPCERIESYRK